MKKPTKKKALEVKLEKIRKLSDEQLGQIQGGVGCATGSGCGCTNTATSVDPN